MNRTYPAGASHGVRNALTSTVLRWLLLCCLAVSGPALAAANKTGGVDAVLLIDSSGSMAKNDPDKLRVPAAKMFMSLLGEEDRIGLISFSDNGYPVLHLTAPGPKTNARILASADRVSSKGVYTNLHAALAKGLAMLEKEGKKGQQPMLVLMSDGRMDVGDTDEDWALTQKLQEDLVAKAKARGVKVYTIAVTEASDVDLLRGIANETGGLFKLARNDKDLHEVFSAIFESAKDPDMLPIEGGEFKVDASIEEVTIVASKEREDVRIYLQAPDGTKLSSDDTSDKLKWFLSHHFDMITLKNPQPGTWKLLYTGGKNRAYIVTNMSLNHSPQIPSLQVNEDMVLEAWLEQDGKLLDKEAVLTNTNFYMEIQVPSGETARFELKDQGREGDRKAADGKSSTVLAYENPGSYQINLIAESATFSRQKTVHFEVQAPPVDLSSAPEPVVETPEPVTEPEPVPEPEAEPLPEEPVAGEEEAVADDEAVVEEETAGEAAEPEKPVKKKMSLGLAIGIFAGINVLLGVIGFGVWWFLKRRKKGANDESEDDEAEEDEDSK
jgi:cbb3-type cytochrome oxidase subunit 3